MPEVSQEHEHSWCVIRLDDNGNEFFLRNQLTREEAERLAAEYQARGHKQSYWASQHAAHPKDTSMLGHEQIPWPK